MRTLSPLAHLEIDQEEIKERVYEAFNGQFGDNFVKGIFIGKYPEGYELVVYVKDKKNLLDILKLSHSLSDEFNSQGLPIAVSTEISKAKSN